MVKSNLRQNRERVNPSVGIIIANGCELSCQQDSAHAKIAPMRLGNVFRRWRLAEDLTLREVSKDVGVPISTLARFEVGEPCDGKTLTAILLWLFGKEK